MLSPDKSVTVLFPHAPHSPLAVALAVGLTALGWEVRCDAEGGSGVPMVIAANGEGRLQLPDVSAAPAASRLLVLVGGLACLSELANGLLLGASAAVNADLPFPEVIGRVDAVLRAGAPQPDDRDCLRGRLH